MTKTVLSVSGGKDSSAMLLKMCNEGIHIDEIIFCDTGLEFDEIYEYLYVLEKETGYKITRLPPILDFEEWFYTVPKRGKLKDKNQIRGFPLEYFGCYIALYNKVNRANKYTPEGSDVYLGYTYDESRRANAKAYKESPNNYYFPLIEWKMTGKDCLDYLEKQGVPHPLGHIFDRTGCWLCPKQSVESLKQLYIHFPEKWETLKKLEADAPKGFKVDLRLEDIEKSVKRE